jgi:hypothetical protein
LIVVRAAGPGRTTLYDDNLTNMDEFVDTAAVLRPVAGHYDAPGEPRHAPAEFDAT